MAFVKLSSDLPNWAWYGDNNTLIVYIRLLLGAVWRDTDYQNTTLKRGQIAVTFPKIAKENGITERQARTILDRLKSTGKVSVKTTSKFSIVTLLDYDCALESVSQNDSRLTVERQTACQSDVRPTLYKADIQNTEKQTTGGFFENADSSVKTNEGFERFWAAYPKKTAKQQAFKAWQRLKPDEGLLSVILTSLERHKKSVQWTKDGGRFIPYPATWLNGRRWEDELQEVNKNGKSCTDIERRSKVEWLRGFE